jgi:hypothetical protein
MRKLISGPAVIAAVIFIGGCTSLPPPQSAPMDLAIARQNVKIYDILPPYSTPIEQITASACAKSWQTPDEEVKGNAMDQLVSLTNQKGGNGLVLQSCRMEGWSFSCWSSAVCTATAIKVAPPPPPPPPPPPRHRKPKPKPKKT